MNDRSTVHLAIKGILVFSCIGLLIVGGLVWRGQAPEGHIVALVGLIGPPMGALCTMLTNTRAGKDEPDQPPAGTELDPLHAEVKIEEKK